MSEGVELALDRDRARPGEAIGGTVTILKPGSQRVEIALHYVERGQGSGAFGRTEPAHPGELAEEFDAGATRRFEVVIPADALPTYRTKSGELSWEVEARSDRRGARSPARVKIDVS